MSLAAYSSAPVRPLSLPTTSAGRPILTRADLDSYDPSPRRAGGRERFFCPIHGGDHQRSLTVDLETGGYACHACGVKGTLREHWPTASFNQGKPRTARPLSIEDLGRRAVVARIRADAERAGRLAAEIGGFCISLQKGAVGSFRRRDGQITGRFKNFAAQDGVS